MKTSEDEPWPGLNKRLRPRKPSCTPSPQNKSKAKTESMVQDRSKRTNKLMKLIPGKQIDPIIKSDFSPTLQFLCPYCDRKFSSRQTISKHVRRMHLHISEPKASLRCLFCIHSDTHAGIMRHMVDHHRNQYFACLDCHIRFYSTLELAEHKLNVCEKQKPYRIKLHQKVRGKKPKKSHDVARKCDVREFKAGQSFNSIVISCELTPMQDQYPADIEDNITTNLILPSSRNLESNTVIENNAIIVLDDVQWNKCIPPKLTFHNADPDQILSRLGVVHRSPRTGESTKKNWFKLIDESTQKFEKCFDTKFYSKVASNVQENMTKFLDGSCEFNSDRENTIRTRKTKNNVVINTADGFPILLASEQYCRSALDDYQPRPIAPKHKWKWENLESDRIVFDPNQLKRDTHTNNCIITLVSRLDIWTQLSMRRKFEDIFNHNLSVEKKIEKQNIITKELKEILESRDIPMTSHILRYTRPTTAASSGSTAGFPMALGLIPTPPNAIPQPAVLSGEWVRPRCYMCCVCGEQSFAPKGLSTHISMNHPNAHVQYYEIVGEKLLNSDILKYLYVPPSQVSNRARLPRGFKECTKCNKSFTLEELHQHMLECAGDTPTVRRRHCRHRPFGVRRRRTRIPENIIQKKIGRDIGIQPRQKNCIRSKPRIRTEVGDAETIRKMLAGLPAKRQRVLVNPVTIIPKSRGKLDRSRNILIMKRSSLEDKPNNICKFPRKTTSSGAKMQFKDNDDRSVRTSSRDDDKPLNSKADNNTLQPNYENRSLKKRQNAIIENKKNRHESLRQPKVVKAAKRKSMRVITKNTPTKNNETFDKTTDTSRTVADFAAAVIEATIARPPLRLDVKKVSYKKRAKANRDASDNQKTQISCSSDDNGERQQPYAPNQNIPLKHSIARLTANSETHDKSVQFHHLFLVQQECNSADKHTSLGLTHLFENETVITRLNKPPLSNKLNKSKKGLNDCIAMLKNKLIEPKTCQITGLICGSHESVSIEPSTLKAVTDNNAARVHILSQSPSDETVQNSRLKENKEFVTIEKQTDKFFTERPATTGKFHETEISISTTKTTDEQVKSGAVNIFDKTKETAVVTFPTDTIQASLNDEQVAVNQVEASVKTRTPPPFGTKYSENKKSIEAVPSKPIPTSIAPKLKENQYILKRPSSNSPTELKKIDTLFLKPAETYLSIISATVSRKPEKPNLSIGVDVGITTACPKLLETSLSIEEVVPPETIPTQCDSPRLPKSDLDEYMSPSARLILKVNPSNSNVTIGQYKPQLSERIDAEIRVNKASNVGRLFLSNHLKTAKHMNLKIGKQNSAEEFTEERIRIIPPAHASTNVASLIAAPLDLSSKVIALGSPCNVDFCNNMCRDTLDLSKKKTDFRFLDIITTKDKVVDLRVKSTQAETSDLCYETSSNNDNANMSHNFPHDFYHPTDLSVKGKDTFMVPLPSSCANDAAKDFSKSKPMCVEIGHSISSTCNSEKTSAVQSEKIFKASSRSPLGISVTDISDLALKSPVKGTLNEITTSDKTYARSKLSNYADQVSKVNQLRFSENRGLKPLESKCSSQILGPVYDPSLKIPHYKIRNKASNTEISLTGELGETTTTSSITAEVFSKTPSGSCNTPNVFGTVSRGTLSGGMLLQTMPYLAKTSNGVTESTVPVYTSIPVTKIETTNFVMSTNPLLSIPGSAITKTAPVCTLTDTIIGTSNQYDGIKNNLLNGSASVQNHVSKTVLRFDPYSQSIPQTPTISKRNASIKIDMNKTDKDPDTARKISMLPTELVEVIGNLPVDQRKQLLNILPQYVCTSKQARTVENASDEANALNIEEQQREPIHDSSIIEKKRLSTYDVHSGIEKIQEPKQDINETPTKILQRSKDVTTGKRTLGISSVNPSINLLSRPLFSNCNRNQKNVFEEDIVPPVTKVLDLSCSVPVPTSGISDPALITINKSLQMSDITKTASLRAVRIKAPSGRQKYNRLLGTEAMVQVKIQRIPETARVVARESVEFINSSAIQQAEISSTQQIKLSNIESKPKSATPVKRTEVNKLNLDVLSTTTHAYLGTEKAPYHLNSKPFIESIKIITDPVCDKSDESHVGIVTYITKEDEKEILKPSKTDENVGDVNNFEKDNQDEYKNAQLLNSDVTVDNDSEDDLILSTIRKIKLNERAVAEACEGSVQTTDKRKTEGKVLKKNTQDRGIMVAGQFRKPVIGMYNAAIKQDNSDKNKLHNQRINKEYNVHKKSIKPSSFLKINEVFNSCLNNKNSKQEITTYPGEGKEYKMLSAKNVSHTLQVCEVTVTEKQEDEKFTGEHHENKRQDPKQMKSGVDSPLREKLLPTIDRQSDLSRIAIKKKTHRGSKIKKDLKQDSKIIEETKDREITHMFFQQKNYKKSYGMNNELVPELQPASKHFDYNVMTPLRQSLRGKSLYIENNSTIFEQDNLSTDMIAEQKAPLTKKQLIFYKLMHDEQTRHKSQSLSPINELNKDDTDKVQPLSSTAITVNALKNRPIKFDKRKLSTKLKRKYKKKTPVCCRNISKVSINNDDMKFGAKKTLGQSFKYHLNYTKGFNTYQTRNKKIIAKEKNISHHEERTICPTKHDMSAGVSENNEETSNHTSSPGDKRKICIATSITGMETDLDLAPKRAKKKMNRFSEMPKMCQHTIKATCISAMEKKSVLKFKTAKPCIDKVSKLPEISQHSSDTRGISYIKNVLAPMTKKEEPSIDRKSASPGGSQCTPEIEDICVTFDGNVNASSYKGENKAVITCYDVPLAARRARSKSVITTSAAGIYDPYDIDLDDMIRIEPLRKPPLKRAKIKRKHEEDFSDFKTQNHTNTKVISTEDDYRLKLNHKRNKKENLLFENKKGHSSAKLRHINCKRNKVSKSVISKYKAQLQTQIVEEGSDSVHSSKSDVIPLKKYFDDMKSIATLKTNVYVETDKEKVAEISKRRYDKNRRSSVTYGITDVVAVESEENVRSEQFMESFGFFSERKPRKSNLLAAKKISETFHFIANESDDSYFDFTDRVSKRTFQSENKKKSADNKRLQKLYKKKKPAVFVIKNCDVCKRVFRRPDNYVRHLLSSLHLRNLVKLELNVTLLIAPQRPNCLVLFRESLKGTSSLQHKLIKLQNDIERTKTVLPTFSQIIIEVFSKAKIVYVSRHCDLNRDEALFLDCCEMLKESHIPSGATQEVRLMSSHITSCYLAVPFGQEAKEDAEANRKYLQFLEREIEKSIPRFGDTTAAGAVMESEEGRNLGRDFIHELKDAACKNADSQLAAAALTHTDLISLVNNVNFSNIDKKVKVTLNNAPKCPSTNKYQKCMKVANQTQPDNKGFYKTKKHLGIKEKIYKDIEEIDMYEDKFDKIKRKCRSQAAAAKRNMQEVRKSITEGHKGRTKLQTKKVKKKSRRTYRNSVLTKGALKGFDVIKVSIPTADINLSAIVPPKEITHKNNREISSKMKKSFEISNNYGSDRQFNDNSHLQKKIDVYEFMDNEDSELFKFRHSSQNAIFKMVSNKEKPSTSKRDVPLEQVDNSSISDSDGDDFVYMSDDYVCSNEDTENSHVSCEVSSVQNHTDKLSLLKRKDFVEKNALMGKIFKNAVRSEKWPLRSRAVVTTIANLDQLFDSLLEEEPSASLSGNPSATTVTSSKYKILKTYDRLSLPRTSSTSLAVSPEKVGKLSKDNLLFSDRSNTTKNSDKKEEECISSPSHFEIPRWYVFGPLSSKYLNEYTPNKTNNIISSSDSKTYKTQMTTADELSAPLLSKVSKFELSADPDDNAGIARQRARRKCTVGKQNVLAETWSSESELDGMSARLYSQSAETVEAGAGRMKKGRKKYKQNSAGRRYKVTHTKKQDVERVKSNRYVVSNSSVTGGFGTGDRKANLPPSPVAGPSGLCSRSSWKLHQRLADWGAEEDESQLQPQHGWIVGDSHKKLVTMLAHAKGRKRYNDGKRNLVE